MAAISLSALISLPFLVSLCCYLLLTTAYTFFLKRRVIVDVVVLAMLYTIRVIAGGVAIGVMISEWLLGFSLFMFTSLALIKRYVELSQLEKLSLAPVNRNYHVSDLAIVGPLAAAAGFNSVTLFGTVPVVGDGKQVISSPPFSLADMPILLYWFGRSLMAHRGVMVDDPIVFVLTDRISRIAIIAILLIVLAAI